MPKVCVLTPMRDASSILDEYWAQLALLDFPPDDLRFVVVEGDSTDDTWPRVCDWAIDDKRVTAIKCNLGRPHYPSIVNPERFYVLATTFNAGIQVILQDDWAEYMQMLPVDVLFGPELIANLLNWERDVIAPMFWHQGGFFYDTWGFQWPPYTRDALCSIIEPEPVAKTTVGGAILARRRVLDAGVHYTTEAVDRGFCYMAREKGFDVWADPTTHIIHR